MLFARQWFSPCAGGAGDKPLPGHGGIWARGRPGAEHGPPTKHALARGGVRSEPPAPYTPGLGSPQEDRTGPRLYELLRRQELPREHGGRLDVRVPVCPRPERSGLHGAMELCGSCNCPGLPSGKSYAAHGKVGTSLTASDCTGRQWGSSVVTKRRRGRGTARARHKLHQCNLDLGSRSRRARGRCHHREVGPTYPHDACSRDGLNIRNSVADELQLAAGEWGAEPKAPALQALLVHRCRGGGHPEAREGGREDGSGRVSIAYPPKFSLCLHDHFLLGRRLLILAFTTPKWSRIARELGNLARILGEYNRMRPCQGPSSSVRSEAPRTGAGPAHRRLPPIRRVRRGHRAAPRGQPGRRRPASF